MAKRSLLETAAAVVSPIITGPATAVLDLPLPSAETTNGSHPKPMVRRTRPTPSAPAIHHHAVMAHDEHGANRQAELFYLQKQIQLQTQMVFILEDRTRIQGVIEWYDRHSIKVRGKSRVLIYKSAIKYLYKAGEVGSHVD